MSDDIPILQEISPIEVLEEPAPAPKRLRWFELILVLLIGFGGFFFSSLRILFTGQAVPPALENLRWAMALFQEATSLLLLKYVLSRRNMGFRDLGLRWSWRDVSMGFLLSLAAYCSYSVGYFVVHLFQPVF